MTAAPRRPFYDRGLFAGASTTTARGAAGACTSWAASGPATYNACATVKWNGGTSFPIESGHGCLGCSEANFWDHGPFYRELVQQVLEAAAGRTEEID